MLLLDLADGPLPEADHPAVEVLALPPETTFGEARRLGVLRARAPVVAFLEEHARACPGWAAALLRAHRGPWAAVGPVVESGNPGRGHSEVVGLMSYGRCRPPQDAASTTRWLPGQNSSLRRSVLLAYGQDLAWMLMNDNLLFARLVRDGHRLTFAPDARIRHYDEATLAATVPSFFHYHRLYGHRRANLFGWTAARRLTYVLASPAIPLYFLVKLDRYLARDGRAAERALLWRQAPFVYLCQLAGALGQAAGLLGGPGDSALAFTRYEVDGDRPGAEA